MRLARALGAGALAAALVTGAAGCGGGSGDGQGGGGNIGLSDDKEVGVLDPSLDPDAGMNPEDVRLSASEVAAGLRVVKELANSATVSFGPNDMELTPDDADDLQAQIAPSWETVAPTVRDRDAATATALEQAFSRFATAIAAKDQAAARTAADAIGAAVDGYVAKFPPENEPGEMPPTDEPGDGSMPAFGDPSATPTGAPSAGPDDAAEPPAQS